MAGEKLEAFLRQYFPEEFGEFFEGESIEDKTIRLLRFLHQKLKQCGSYGIINFILGYQIFFARRALERLQSGTLTVQEAADELSTTLDSLTKDALIQYIKEQHEEIAAPGQPYNDRRYTKE